MRQSTLIAAVALGVVSAVAAVAVTIADRPASRIAAGTKLFPGLAAKIDTATQLEVTKEGKTYTLARTKTADGKEAWGMPDKGSYPVRFDLVRQVLVAAAELETVEPKTRKPDLYERLNVTDVDAKDSRSTGLTVKDAGGTVLADLIVGKARFGSLAALQAGGADTAMTYVRKKGDAQAWLARGQLDLKTSAIEWTDRVITEIPGEQVVSVDLKPVGTEPTHLSRAKVEDKDFAIDAAPANMQVKAQYDVNTLADTLNGLSFDDVAPADSVLAPTGPVSTAVFKTAEGLTVTVTQLPKGTETWTKIQASGEGDAAIAKAKELNDRLSPWAYRLPDYRRAKFETKKADLFEAKKPAS